MQRKDYLSEGMGSNEEPQDTKKRRLALINVLRSSDNPFTKISPACASAGAGTFRYVNVCRISEVLGHSEFSTNAMFIPIKTHRYLGDT